MKPSSRRVAQPLQILLFGALYLVIHLTVVKTFGLQAKLAESNLQANLIRINEYLYGKPAAIVLVGSSIGGRLLPGYFAEGGIDVQNLGLDGSRPLMGFKVVRMRQPLPRIMLVDTSTLFQPLGPNDAVIQEAVHSPGFAFSRYLPFFRPEYRPSSIVYSHLKGFVESRNQGHILPPVAEPGSVSVEFPDQSVQWRPEDQYAVVRAELAAFQAQGVDVRLVFVPAGSGWGQPLQGLWRKLAEDLGLPVLEPGPEFAARGVALHFTDIRHLASGDARRVALWIAGRLPGGKTAPSETVK